MRDMSKVLVFHLRNWGSISIVLQAEMEDGSINTLNIVQEQDYKPLAEKALRLCREHKKPLVVDITLKGEE